MNQETLQKIDFEELSQKVINDNPILISKITTSTKLNENKVIPLLSETLKFLFLIEYSQRILTPSHPVDLAWHELILCTRYYMQFCEENFVRYIHHHPGGLEEENKRRFQDTLQLYAEVFGSVPSEFWITDMSDDMCGSCNG